MSLWCRIVKKKTPEIAGNLAEDEKYAVQQTTEEM